MASHPAHGAAGAEGAEAADANQHEAHVLIERRRFLRCRLPLAKEGEGGVDDVCHPSKPPSNGANWAWAAAQLLLKRSRA